MERMARTTPQELSQQAEAAFAEVGTRASVARHYSKSTASTRAIHHSLDGSWRRALARVRPEPGFLP